MSVPTLEQQGTCAAPSIALRRIVWSSVLGTTVEWYDFLIYGTAAALLFNKLFFPSFGPQLVPSRHSVLMRWALWPVRWVARFSVTSAIASAARPCWP